MIQDKEQKKKEIVAEIIRQKGFKGVACTAIGLNPRTFRQWMAEDAEFRQAVDDAVDIAKEYRDEVAEKALFDLVEAKDTTAVIFYNKTRNEHKGYTERIMPQQPKEEPKPETPALSGQTADEETAKRIKAKISGKKAYLVKLLKDQGKYTAELSIQATVTAQLLVRTEILAEEILAEGHEAINVELSREGNERKSISPKEKLYLDFVEKSQKALRALGMNTDSKDRKTDGDDFKKFMEDFSDDNDD
jgi:hypothetical protein